jgi:NADH:ubiquinone oxidoreductase subunit K
MSPVALRRVIWAMIYSGLLLVVVGLYIHRIQAEFGLMMIVIGAIDVLIGLVLIVVRSRMKDGP